jgi:hypothetical protein
VQYRPFRIVVSVSGYRCAAAEAQGYRLDHIFSPLF